MEGAREGTPVAGITSNTVPWELLRAAGYFPVMLNPGRGPVPVAGEFMEDGVFRYPNPGNLRRHRIRSLAVPQDGGDSTNIRAGTQVLSLFARGSAPRIRDRFAGAVSLQSVGRPFHRSRTIRPGADPRADTASGTSRRPIDRASRPRACGRRVEPGISRNSKTAGSSPGSRATVEWNEGAGAYWRGVFYGTCGVRAACSGSSGRVLRSCTDARCAHPDKGISAPSHRFAPGNRVAPRRGRCGR